MVYSQPLDNGDYLLVDHPAVLIVATVGGRTTCQHSAECLSCSTAWVRQAHALAEICKTAVVLAGRSQNRRSSRGTGSPATNGWAATGAEHHAGGVDQSTLRNDQSRDQKEITAPMFDGQGSQMSILIDQVAPTPSGARRLRTMVRVLRRRFQRDADAAVTRTP